MVFPDLRDGIISCSRCDQLPFVYLSSIMYNYKFVSCRYLALMLCFISGFVLNLVVYHDGLRN